MVSTNYEFSPFLSDFVNDYSFEFLFIQLANPFLESIIRNSIINYSIIQFVNLQFNVSYPYLGLVLDNQLFLTHSLK